MMTRATRAWQKKVADAEKKLDDQKLVTKDIANALSEAQAQLATLKRENANLRESVNKVLAQTVRQVGGLSSEVDFLRKLVQDLTVSSKKIRVQGDVEFRRRAQEMEMTTVISGGSQSEEEAKEVAFHE